ncbi:hypothetical protein PTSG_11014 [Salpingoeca rosetta]|uniref:Cobalamin adenosyltransferase-like domain-containing protein n=1 Tax=Salpingoeca rosetta (strain ATCC 50818 / BSB-021) TaxID=946362 RepID=F2USG0_SALR5|nr:uncharacterized protein PTSG_11014 [Salpingoeca rosetta]EGD81069.1 hypothetical protein PTSG_11014 [Salpingoeca rosetta]|eukprot:XP_004987938.1 hypothetical protein PTSG_11014 [Salpingoeca rosetta]
MGSRQDTGPQARKPPKSMLYTRTGDKGTSQLYTGQRRPKTDIVFECLGHVDELNSQFGLVREHLDARLLHDVDADLHEIQCLLMELGTHIASPGVVSVKDFDDDATNLKWLERRIDELDSELPPLRNFILPSGGKAAAHMHLARCVCRRAERALVHLRQCSNDDDNDDNGSDDDDDDDSGGACSAAALKFINRLSDFAFCCARVCAFRTGGIETVFQSKPDRRHIHTRAATSKEARAHGGGSGSSQVLVVAAVAVAAAVCGAAIMHTVRRHS